MDVTNMGPIRGPRELASWVNQVTGYLSMSDAPSVEPATATTRGTMKIAIHCRGERSHDIGFL